MEIKNVFLQVQIIFIVISYTSSIPVAQRSPFKEIKHASPWSLVKLQSEEDYGHDVDSDVNTIPSSVRKTLKYPDHVDREKVASVIVLYRNSIPRKGEHITDTRSEPRLNLERFYKQPTLPRVTERERIVFPKDDDDYVPRNRQKSDTVSGARINADNSNDAVLSNQTVTKDKEDEYVTNSNVNHSHEQLGQFSREVLFGFPDVFENPEATDHVTTTEQVSNDEELNVQEQSLYSGPKLKEQEGSDDGCPEGFKKTRHGSCQKPSRRLIQTG